MWAFQSANPWKLLSRKTWPTLSNKDWPLTGPATKVNFKSTLVNEAYKSACSAIPLMWSSGAVKTKLLKKKQKGFCVWGIVQWREGCVGTVWVDGNTLYVGRDSGYTDVYLYPNLINGKLRFLHICILKASISKHWNEINNTNITVFRSTAQLYSWIWHVLKRGRGVSEMEEGKESFLKSGSWVNECSASESTPFRKLFNFLIRVSTFLDLIFNLKNFKFCNRL